MEIKYAVKATMAVFERQLVVLWRKKLYFILGLVLPAFFIFGIGPAIQNLTAEGVTTEYIATGIITITIIFTAMQGPYSLLYDRDLGYLKVELVSPIPRYSIILGESMAGAFRALLQCIIMLTIAVLSGLTPGFIINPSTILGFLAVAMLTAIFIEGFFSSILAISKNTETFALISNFVGLPFIFMSNTFFPTSSYRNTLFFFIEYAGFYNPVNLSLNGVRFFLIGTCPGFEAFEPWIGPVSILVILLLAVGSIIMGTKLFLRSLKR